MAQVIEQAREFGIQPIPSRYRVLGIWDNFVLWFDLGVSFLVILVGALIAPGLGLAQTVLAILIGAIIGNLLLGLAATVGSDTGVPTMVLLRAVLGIRGSYISSVLNILQLVGWATFEIVIMGLAADSISRQLFGFSNQFFWTLVFAAIVTAMAVFGPIAIVRQWMKKFAIWVVLATTIWLTYQIFANHDIASLWSKAGDGKMTFWLAVDLVAVMAISWMPLVADYSRFARRTRDAFWGTGLGYFLAHFWMYALGALLALSLAVSSPDDLFGAIGQMVAGVVVLLIILVHETDEGFANIYSTAVSTQNILPWASNRVLSVIFGAVCAVVGVALIASGTPLLQYESFLLLIGAAFVPLMGLLAADYFVLRGRRYDVGQLYQVGGRYWYAGGFNRLAVVAWILGAVVYLLISGLPPLGVPGVTTAFGSTLPSFLVAFVAYLILGRAVVGEPAQRPA